MENQENKPASLNFKSQILLPVLFIISLIVAIMFASVDGFIEELNAAVVWVFFAVGVLYLAVATYDLITSKEKTRKTKMFIFVMEILTTISLILYLVFYLVFK